MEIVLNFAAFVWYTFVLGICRHLPILAAYLLMVLVISGRIGRGLGVPLLIWDERHLRRYFSGLALTLFFAKLFVVGFLLTEGLRAEAIKNLHRPVPSATPGFLTAFQSKWVEPLNLVESTYSADSQAATQQRDRILNYFCYMSVIFVIVMGIVRLFGPFQVSQFRSRFRMRPPAFALGVGSAIGLVALLTWGIFALLEFSFAQTLAHGLQGLADTFQKAQVRETGEAWVHVGSLFFVVLLLLTYFVYRLDRRARYVTPVLTVCTVLALACSAYGVFVFWIWTSPLFREIPLALILVLVAVGMLWLGGGARYKFQFSHIDGVNYSEPLPLPMADLPPAAGAAPASPVDLLASAAAVSAPQAMAVVQAALPPAPAAYRDEHAAAPSRPTRPLVVLCVSGGASRAAVWVALVLRELNKKIPGFSHHIRLVTGASGGMVGAAYHVATLQRPANWPNSPGPCSFATRSGRSINLDDMVRHLAADAVSPIIHRLLFYDLWGLVWPRSLGNDRGSGLEDGWHNQLDEALDQPLRGLAAGEREGWRPILVFSPMMVEDGRRLLISNEPLGYLTDTVWPSLDNSSERSHSAPAVEFGDLFPQAVDFRVSTAARMSASFPYISPAALLPTRPRRRVVDAGYYDNYGIDLASSWIFHHARVLTQQYTKVILIQIRDALDEDSRRNPASPTDMSNRVSRGLEGFTSPPEGALAARSSVMAYRNDRQLQVLHGLLTALTHNPHLFKTVLFENPTNVSMSWYVAPEELEALDNASTDRERQVQKRIERLNAWWNSSDAAL
jgi:hypothetical protein